MNFTNASCFLKIGAWLVRPLPKYRHPRYKFYEIHTYRDCVLAFPVRVFQKNGHGLQCTVDICDDCIHEAARKSLRWHLALRRSASHISSLSTGRIKSPTTISRFATTHAMIFRESHARRPSYHELGDDLTPHNHPHQNAARQSLALRFHA